MNRILNERELFFNNTSEAFKQLLETARVALCEGSRLDVLERDLLRCLLSVGLACLKDFIEAAGDGDQGEEIKFGDQLLKRSTAKQNRVYHSIFGELDIARYVYSVRAKTKALAKPLDQQLGLPADETSYVLEDWLGDLSVEMPFASVVSWLERTLGIKVSAATCHRRIEKLGNYAEDFNDQRESVPLAEEKEILVALADGKGVPIRTPFDQRAEQELGIKLPHRPARKDKGINSKHRSTVGDQNVKTQRATAGAFYSVAPFERTAEELLGGKSRSGIVPTNKRLFAEMNLIVEDEVSRGAVRVFQSLAQEVAQRDPERLKPLVCLMDGDRHLWKLQQEYLPDAIPILDFFHATEKLWTAAHCFHPDASLEAERLVEKYLRLLLENKVDVLRGLLKRRLNKTKLSKTKRKNLQAVYNYFTTNRQRMRYGDYIAAGYPVGSGVIEGACKHIIGDRMCMTGMRWEFEGAQVMLDARVAKLNGQWKQFIEYRIQTEQKQLYNLAA